MEYINYAVILAAGIAIGILIGRNNKKLVENIVAEVKKVVPGLKDGS